MIICSSNYNDIRSAEFQNIAEIGQQRLENRVKRARADHVSACSQRAVKLIGARRALEIGVFTGSSTLRNFGVSSAVLCATSSKHG
jgi:predicted O-methyltransferase YrrM